MKPKYPNVKVKLVGTNGNAFAILGKCIRAAKSYLDKDQIKAFQSEATSGDYDHLLQTAMKWFEVQ